MAQPDPIKNDRRRARKQLKLPADAVCVLCGETTPAVLLRVERTVLDGHHPLGEGIAPELTVPLCRNCHAVQTQAQLDVGVALRRQRRALPEVVASVLCALGVFLKALGDRLLRWGKQLNDLVSAFDRDLPGWRELPEAAA
jgi:hypothetical protein